MGGGYEECPAEWSFRDRGPGNVAEFPGPRPCTLMIRSTTAFRRLVALASRSPLARLWRTASASVSASVSAEGDRLSDEEPAGAGYRRIAVDALTMRSHRGIIEVRSTPTCPTCSARSASLRASLWASLLPIGDIEWPGQRSAGQFRHHHNRQWMNAAWLGSSAQRLVACATARTQQPFSHLRMRRIVGAQKLHTHWRMRALAGLVIG